MALIVQKFGGSSVANAERIAHVAGIITNAFAQGNQVVAVVSAQGGVTDSLLEKAKEINPKASKREMDVLLSTGEQASMALLSMAIEKLGFPVISLTGAQAGILTDASHSAARIKRIDTERLESELSKKNIVIVAGFQGANRYDNITTLGRGGSDTSAVAVAAALGADRCYIYTDVDGVYTADPRLIPNAKKLEEITYDEMLELASLGAKVLHNRSVEMAKKYQVEIEVLSSLENKPGTIVKEAVLVEKMLIKGVAKDGDVARISVLGVCDKPGVAYKLFSMLAAKKVNVDVILQSVGRDGTRDITFTTGKSHREAALETVNSARDVLKFQDVEWDENVAKVSIVGAGMETNPGVASTLFEALSEANVNIQMISTSEIKISVLIAAEDADKAVKAVHDAFYI